MQYRFKRACVAATLAGAALTLVTLQPHAQQARMERIGDKPNLNGIWQALNNAHWNLEAHSATRLEDFWQLGAVGAIPADRSVVEGGTIPYLPEALAKRDENRAGWPKSDPEAACYLPGIPRANYMPYPFQIVQGDSDILFVYEYATANRPVHMTDIRTLDDVPVDMWMGWSNGSWDGDTLIVETIANDDRTWLDRAGNHHSSAMVVTERISLIDENHIQYEATIDDPNTFSRPWTISMPLHRRMEPNAELLEFK